MGASKLGAVRGILGGGYGVAGEGGEAGGAAVTWHFAGIDASCGRLQIL